MEPVFADDACMRYPCDASWHIDNKVRNRQMHALMGNSFDLVLWIWCFFFFLNVYILMYSALTLGTYVFDMADETENMFSGNLLKEIWMFVTSLIYFFGLNAVRCHGKKPPTTGGTGPVGTSSRKEFGKEKGLWVDVAVLAGADSKLIDTSGSHHMLPGLF